jgi:predicted ester cyclase
VEDQIAEGDEVANRWSFRGRHTGEFAGVAPTGNEVQMDGQVIFRFTDGMIHEGWWNWDVFGLMQHIGAIPADQPV